MSSNKGTNTDMVWVWDKEQVRNILFCVASVDVEEEF